MFNVKLTHLETTMRAMRSLKIQSNNEKPHWILANLIGVPDVIWGICLVYWGKMWWKIEFRWQKNSSSICNVTFLVYFLTRLDEVSSFLRGVPR